MSISKGKYRYSLSKRSRSRITDLGNSTFIESDCYSSSLELSNSKQHLVNQNLPRILEAVYGSKKYADSPRSVEIPTTSEFIQAAVSASIAGSVENWLLNLGLGGSERIPSWRLIEQISPILESALTFQRAGFGTPRVQIFKANNLAIFANCLDSKMVAASSIATMIFIKGYVSDWYPTLLHSLELEEDSRSWLAKIIDEILGPIARALPLDLNMEKLSRGRSSCENAMIYGLAHAFQLQHICGIEASYRSIWTSGNIQILPDAVVTFGGVPERLFADVIESAVAAAPLRSFCAVPRVRSITRRCRKPSYMPLPEEISIKQIPTLSEMRSQSKLSIIASDWRQLMKRHEFDLAIASSSDSAPLARISQRVNQAMVPGL